MAVSTLSKFNWDKILSKVDSNDVKRSLNHIRAKANEVAAAHGRFGSAPEVVNFSAYKNKLKFTSSAVDALEKIYANKKLPTFTAEVPALENKKRAMMLAATENIVAAANAELSALTTQIEAFEQHRITKDTRYIELAHRFPAIAKDIEHEINTQQWSK